MTRADPLVIALQEWTGAFMRRSMHGWVLFMKENDLSMSQVGALFQINHGRSNVSELGDGLGISLPAASQMLDRLVQQELIRRSEDPQDRRVKQLVLTGKGCLVLQKSVQARQGWLKGLVATMSAGEKEQIAAALRIMIDKTKQLDQQPGSEG